MRRRRTAGGFTLVELLISLALSMVGLLGLLALQVVTVRGNAASRNVSEAVALMQAKLEDLQALPLANLAAQAGTETLLSPNPAELPASPKRIYTRITTVNVGVAQTTISVEVDWPNEQNPGTPHKIIGRAVRAP